MADHEVKPGDCFSSVAQANGYTDYHVFYDRADNAELKAKRPNPNMLVPGDRISLAEATRKEVDVPTGQQHVFRQRAKKTTLRISLMDAQDKPVEVLACSLSAGDARIEAKPGDQPIELEIDPEAKRGVLLVKIAGWKPEASPARTKPAPPSPPPYPPPVDDDEFEDATDVPQGEELEIEWRLELGALEPASTDHGCLQRLTNLGFSAPEGKSESVEAAAAVKGYQRKHKLTPRGGETGKIEDVRAHLEQRYDKP